MENQNQCIKKQRTKNINQIDIKNGVLLTILACKSSQQSVLSLVSLECFFSMCLRCGHLIVLWLSGKKVHWDPLYRLMPRTGPPWMRLLFWLYRPALVFLR